MFLANLSTQAMTQSSQLYDENISVKSSMTLTISTGGMMRPGMDIDSL